MLLVKPKKDFHRSKCDNIPKTGKRGVPQQFPRRLYEMIESESTSAAHTSSNSSSDGIIRWSDTGRAFHIKDTQRFSAEVLPKYFRTNKFSSFQRNLNLVSDILPVFIVHQV